MPSAVPDYKSRSEREENVRGRNSARGLRPEAHHLQRHRDHLATAGTPAQQNAPYKSLRATKLQDTDKGTSHPG